MKQRCPHCQTTPLRADAETCWYCGKEYVVRGRTSRTTRDASRVALPRRRGDSRAPAPRPG